MVTDEWKYAYSAGDDREILFNRRNDILETQNVANMPLTDVIQASLKQVLLKHLDEVGETTAGNGADWRRYPNWTPPTSPIVGQRVYDHPWSDLHIPGYSS